MINKTLFTLFFFIILSSALIAGGHKWHLGIFPGATTNFDAEHTNFSLGADLEYKLDYAHNLFGIGLLGDIVFAEHQESLLMGAVIFHPSESLKFVLGNGVAYSSVVIDEIEETESAHVLRVGTAYDIHLSHFTVSPTLNYDVIHGHGALAYGITLGLGF